MSHIKIYLDLIGHNIRDDRPQIVSLFRQGGGQDRGPAEKHPEEDADTGIHGCAGLTVKQANREIMIRGLKTRTNCP